MPPRAAAARAACQRARGHAVRSRCLSPVGVDARTPGQLGFVGSARVAQRQIDRLGLVIPINAAVEHANPQRTSLRHTLRRFWPPNSRTRPASCLRRSRPLPPRARCTPEEAVAQGCCDFLVRCILSKGRAHVGVAQGVAFRSSLCHSVVLLGRPVRCSARAPPVAAVSGLHHQPVVAANGTLTRLCHP